MFLRNKKSQMEFVGLAIVIVLLILGGLFLMTFNRGELDTARQDIANMELANNFLSTLLESQANCSQHTFKDLLQDASSLNPVIECENKHKSIEQIDSMTKDVLSNTLDKWKKGYELKITIPNNAPKNYASSGGCSGKRVIRPARYPVPDDIVLELKICD